MVFFAGGDEMETSSPSTSHVEVTAKSGGQCHQTRISDAELILSAGWQFQICVKPVYKHASNKALTIL